MACYVEIGRWEMVEALNQSVEGSLDIDLENFSEREALPRYRVFFARYSDFLGGAQPFKRIYGADALERYLIELGFDHNDAKGWLAQVHDKKSVRIDNVRLTEQQAAIYVRKEEQ
jgi:hypothetical protein